MAFVVALEDVVVVMAKDTIKTQYKIVCILYNRLSVVAAFFVSISIGYRVKSIDYDPCTETSKLFFKMVQNKLHYAAHGHTAAEVIYDRADAEKPFMGLTSFKGEPPSEYRQSLQPK